MGDKTFWYVSTYVPDYPEEVTQLRRSADGHHYLFGEDYMYVAGPDELFSDKTEALEVARARIRARIRTMHEEGMEDREYDRSREWADAVVKGIGWELEYGHVFDPRETMNYLREIRRERGGW